MSTLKNINRGFRKLIVWQDALAYYELTYAIFRTFPYEVKRVAANQIAAVDSIHRNIAEGYCRRSLKEYLYHLNVALGSAGESVSGLHAYYRAGQITAEQFHKADQVAYKLENGMVKLVERLQQQQQSDQSWSDSFIVKESNAVYTVDASGEQTSSD